MLLLFQAILKKDSLMRSANPMSGPVGFDCKKGGGTCLRKKMRLHFLIQWIKSDPVVFDTKKVN